MPKSSQQAARPLAPTRWQENHGNLLLSVIVIILVFGSSIIAYRQTRAPRPRLPTTLRVQGGDPSGVEQTSTSLWGGERQDVAVRVIGAASDAGTIKVAIYSTAEGFDDLARALAVESWKIRSGVAEGHFLLPSDVREVAIVAYHDANDNAVLDRNSLGIPTERYGYSTNGRAGTGPAKFAEAVVRISDEPIQISIR